MAAILVGGAIAFAAAPVFAQEFSPPPIVVKPLMAPTPKAITAPPEPKVADTHVESTELGFDQGVGPAVGRKIEYRQKLYEVTDIATKGGGPTFSGNSRFAIAPEGKVLIIGLKAVDPEELAALPQLTGQVFN